VSTGNNALKRKVAQRWDIISHAMMIPSPATKAFIELEYILTEAGLLPRRRQPRYKQAELPLKESPTTNDDNTMSLSEEVGRNYSE
jgi:hypothetical protein